MATTVLGAELWEPGGGENYPHKVDLPQEALLGRHLLYVGAAERVLRLVDERCPPGCENVFDYVARDEMEALSRRYQRIAGFDREAVNERPA